MYGSLVLIQTQSRQKKNSLFQFELQSSVQCQREQSQHSECTKMGALSICNMKKLKNKYCNLVFLSFNDIMFHLKVICVFVKLKHTEMTLCI